MVRPAEGSLASSAVPGWSHMLFGCDGTEGIVSVDANTAGQARVWRRLGNRVQVSEHSFPNWFLTTSLDLMAHLPTQRLHASALRGAHGEMEPSELLTLIELAASDRPDEDAYRYLVLTQHLNEVETALVEMANKRYGGEAETLRDLRGLVLVRPAIEQFLTLTGRTYFKGMQFDDLHRLQFDLETTGLDEDRDRIFMVSVHDSGGWYDCLDTASSTEAQLIERLVELVQARDPDVLENHNIHAFDLPFLVKRAARLGVRLALGRDGSEPWQEEDVLDTGERAEPFLRWRVAGREVIDTQHAVRRFAFAAPDLRRHGLKDAARYFGLAREDREYVPGAEIWPTYRMDPDRIRRYAAHDVDEVDALSRRLMPGLFGLATVVPRPYEVLAADSSPTALWEPLLLRAYLHDARAIAAPTPRLQAPLNGLDCQLFLRGVLGPSVRAALQPLLPSVLADNVVHAANDELAVMPELLGRLIRTTGDEWDRLLVNAAYPYLAGQGLFSDPQAATDAAALGRRYLDRLVDDLRRRDCAVVAVDGEQLLFGVPQEWDESSETEVARAAATYLPPGVELIYAGRYQALYARGPRSTMMLGGDGAVTLAGETFRPSRLERFGEAFMLRAAPLAMTGDVVGLRRVFLETVHQLRVAQVALNDLCVQVTLHKSAPQYRRAELREEPYEVLLGAGMRSWRVGQRIRYFRARGGEPRLWHESPSDELSPGDADTEYYVQRLYGAYCKPFAHAFTHADFGRIFAIPEGPGPFDDASEIEAELRSIRPITTTLS